MGSFRRTLIFLLLIKPSWQTFSWIGKQSTAMQPSIIKPTPNYNDNHSFSITNAFDKAVEELDRMETRPYCHRIATALLVQNCHQLVDHEDSTVEHNGPLVRDLVDAYAASLALCDLERGRVPIPKQCWKFREDTLKRLQPQSNPSLHVSGKEINDCIHAFASDNKMWETWHNYRHRTEIYCQVAGSDKEKESLIRFYRNISKTMTDFFVLIGTKQEEALRSYTSDLEDTKSAYVQILAGIGNLDETFAALQALVKSMTDNVQKSSDASEISLRRIQKLNDYAVTHSQGIIDKNAQMATTLESHLLQIQQGIGPILAEILAAASSVSSMSQEIGDMGGRTANLAEALMRVSSETEVTIAKQKEIRKDLSVMQRDINQIQSGIANVSGFTALLLKWTGVSHWWLYITCPTVSLFVGSHQLEPSLARNALLFTLGEGFAMFVDAVRRSYPFIDSTTERPQEVYSNGNTNEEM